MIELPLGVVTVFLSAFGSLIILIAGWGYAIVRKNTSAIKMISEMMIEMKQKDKDDTATQEEKHKLIDCTLRDHSIILKEHDKDITILKFKIDETKGRKKSA